MFLETPHPPFNRRSRISVATNNPNDAQFIVQTATEFDGVVGLGTEQNIHCTGSLLYTSRHILTVAHCFNQADGTANLTPNPDEYTVFFDLSSGRMAVGIENIFIHPNWTADFDNNYDIAIIELLENAPSEADRYQVYTEFDEVGQVFEKVGYGLSGTGLEGENTEDSFSIKRKGKNQYDALSQIFNNNPESHVVTDSQLAYDFDSGLPENDAFGIEYDIPDLGLGIEEIGISSGDSGSPAFIQGKIAGLSSFGQSPSHPGIDVTPGNNTSFGEFFSDTRVSIYVPWIESTIAFSNQGNDFIEGTHLADELNGNQGNDRIQGLDEQDTLFGGQGDDTIWGDNGNDLLFGNRFNDLIYAGNGDDQVYGGQGNDQLMGGEGNDTLSGDDGQDSLTGNEGSDLFILSIHSGVDDIRKANQILDFTSEDFIGLTGELILENIGLEVSQLDGQSGLLIRNRLSEEILGFIHHVTIEKVQGNLVFV